MNTDIIWHDEFIFLKIGSALFFQGGYLFVNSSIFKSNNGRIGGAMQLQSSFNMAQKILIKNSIFSNNYAGKGGALGINGNFLDLNVIVENNFFYNNSAPGKKFKLPY